MSPKASLAHRLQARLWRNDPSREGRLVRGPLAALRFVVVIVGASRDPGLNLRAMGLVYNTLLSLVPLLAVAFSVLKAFGVHYRIEPFLARALEPLGPRGDEITAYVVQFVDNMQVGVLGAVGIAGLLYTVLALLDRIEFSLNYIWQVRRGRGLARKFTDYVSILLVGPVLIVAAFAIIASAQSHWLVQRIIAITPFESVMVFVAGQVMPFVFLCAAFSFLYAFGPNTRVRGRSAVVGGAVAAVLWQGAGVAFAAFIAGSTRYTAIYSSFAVLVVFLIWLYVGWLVVLIGGQVAYFDQYPASYVAARTRHGVSYRERIALDALAEIGRRHLGGLPPIRLADVASAIQAPVAVRDELVEDLVRAGILLRSAEPDAIALALAPDVVPVTAVLSVVRDPEPSAPRAEGTDAVSAVLEARDRAERGALDGVTVGSLIGEPARTSSLHHAAEDGAAGPAPAASEVSGA
jgi:membrane protein